MSLAAAAAAAAEGLLLALVVLGPWPYGGAADAARYAMAAAALLCAALGIGARGMEGAGLPRLSLAALALPLLPLLQLLAGASAAPWRTADAALLLAAAGGLLAFTLDRTADVAPARRLAAAVLVGCTAQAVFAAVQSSVAPGTVYGRASDIVTAPFGSFANHNHFAALVEMGALLSAGMAWGAYRRAGSMTPRALLLAALAFGLAAAHLASGSRGGLLALAAGGAALVTLRLAGPGSEPAAGARRWLLAGAALLALLALALAMVAGPTRARLASVARGRADASGAYRVDMAVASARLAASRPLLGSGLGAFEDAVPPFKRGHGAVRTTHAESDVMELLAEAGLAGGLAAAALGLLCWRSLAERLRHRRERERRWLALGAAGACAALLAHSLIDFGLRLPAVAVVFVALLGLAAAPRQPPRSGGRALPLALAAALALLAVAAGWRALAAVEVASARAVPDLQQRLRRLSATLARHPYSTEARRERALAWAALAGARAQPDRLQRAARDLEAALQGRPRWSQAWAELAWVRERLGDTAGARAAHARAAAHDPANLRLGVARAGFRSRSEGPGAAVEELARLRQLNPGWTAEEAVGVARAFTRDAALLQRLGPAPAP